MNEQELLVDALRAGLPLVADRFQPVPPDGYFKNDYGLDRERIALELSMRQVKQKSED